MEQKHCKESSFSITKNGKFCAIVENGDLNVYDVIENKLLYKAEGSDVVKSKALRFSPTNEAIAWLKNFPNNVIIIFIKEQKFFEIKGHPHLPIHETTWSPDGKTLALFSILSVFIDIYKVDCGQSSHIASINGASEDDYERPLAQYSPDGKHFATVNVCKQGYSITIYRSGDTSWHCVQRMECDDSYHVKGMIWCPDSASLLVWQSESSLRMRLWAANGTVERTLITDDAAVCCVCLSDCGRLAAILTTNCEVRTLDLLTWRLDLTDILVHLSILHTTSARSRLRESGNLSTQVSTCELIKETFYELNKDETLLPKHRTLAQLSDDGQYLATCVASYPSTLWVWQLVGAHLDTVVVLKDNTHVIDIFWHKDKVVISANLNSGRVLVWTPEETKIFNCSFNHWPFTAEEYLASLETISEEEC